MLLSLAELLVLAQNDDDLPEPALTLGSPRGSLWSPFPEDVFVLSE